MVRAFLLAVLTAVLASAAEPVGPQSAAWALAMDGRYAPNVDWPVYPELHYANPEESAPYWRTPAQIREARSAEEAPLAGLRLALDPGHVGGLWAPFEGREFRVAESDHWIREGELVLQVAELLRERLEALGAEVSLLREANEPVNPRQPADYLDAAARQLGGPADASLPALVDYAIALRDEATRMAVLGGEIQERARLVNEELRPDALVSLHINAGPWPKTEEGGLRLVEGDHSHVLVFGCATAAELAQPRQRERLREKVAGGSGLVELELGDALARKLGEGFGLPASGYDGGNAVRPLPENPYLWARNLMLLRLVDCPAVLLEPFLANSEGGYAALQAALETRAGGGSPGPDDILVRYADAVVEGLLEVYGASRAPVGNEGSLN